MTKSERLYTMAERIAKFGNKNNKLDILKSMTHNKEHINYARSKILSEKLDILKESNIWNYKTDNTGTTYMKAIGNTKYSIKVKNGKIINSSKSIDGDEFDVEPSVLNDFNIFLKKL